MKMHPFVEFFLFLAMLMMVSLGLPSRYLSIILFLNILLRALEEQYQKRKLRDACTTYSEFFFLTQVKDFFLVQNFIFFLLGFESWAGVAKAQPLSHLLFYLLLTSSRLLDEIALYYRMREHPHIRIHFYLRFSLISLVSVFTSI